MKGEGGVARRRPREQEQKVENKGVSQVTLRVRLANNDRGVVDESVTWAEVRPTWMNNDPERRAREGRE